MGLKDAASAGLPHIRSPGADEQKQWGHLAGHFREKQEFYKNLQECFRILQTLQRIIKVN